MPNTPSLTTEPFDPVQFPYRKRPDESTADYNARIGIVLAGVENMLHLQAIKVMPDLQDEDRENMVQDMRVALWLKALPRYDSTKGTKVTSFIYTCARRFALHCLRDHIRRKRRRVQVDFVPIEHLCHIPVAGDTAFDDRISDLAERIMRDGHAALTPRQSDLLKLWLQRSRENPNVQVKEIAAELGFRQDSSCSMLFKRLKDTLCELELTEPSTYE